MVSPNANCQFCYSSICCCYTHEQMEEITYHCMICEGDADGTTLTCLDCKNIGDIYFYCDKCDECDDISKINDICYIYDNNADLIIDWYKNIKRNKVLWKIAEYYTNKKYNHNANIIINWYKNIKRNKVLWKIAEYYTSKKYKPEHILKYLNLE